MALDLGQMHGLVVEQLGQQMPLAESMACIIDRCAAARPHPDWDRLRALPYGDTAALAEWLERPFAQEPSLLPLRGLWFGLFNPCPDGRTPVADLYVCGSIEFNPDPNDNAWAVEPDWWPEARYAHSTLLAEIYRIAYRQGAPRAEQDEALGNDAEYPLCLGYGALVVQSLLRDVEPSLLLGKAEAIGVAAGFDSGDFVLVGELTSAGLRPLSPKAAK